jgi:hypothetical protein
MIRATTALARDRHAQITMTILNPNTNYMSVSEELSALAGYDNPTVGPSAVRGWLDHAPAFFPR